eukprot:scaffold128909_cov42-Phaeocystis_antarctica.AAC.2
MITYGCSRWYLRLQPLPHTVAASATYGCRIHQLCEELQAKAPALGKLALSPAQVVVNLP